MVLTKFSASNITFKSLANPACIEQGTFDDGYDIQTVVDPKNCSWKWNLKYAWSFDEESFKKSWGAIRKIYNFKKLNECF